MIDLKDKWNFRLAQKLEDLGFPVIQIDGVLTSKDELLTQQYIDKYDDLQDFKEEKIDKIKEQTVHRVNRVVLAFSSFEQIAVLFDLWASIANTAKKPNNRWAEIENIYTAATTAIKAIRQATNKKEVRDVEAIWP